MSLAIARRTRAFLLKPKYLAALLAVAGGACAASDFNPLTIPTGIPAPYPTGISGDGSVIVGGPEDNGSSTVGSAVRWTNSGANVELLVTPVGTVNSSAKAISTDGSAIVGWVAANSAPSQALLWTSGGFQILTDLAGTTGGSKALGVSSTGSFVVGVGNLSNVDQAVRWRTSDNSVLGLGQLAGGSGSRAAAVSSDGGIVIGTAFNASSSQRAFIWRESTSTMSELQMLAGAYNQSAANGISADGSIVAGRVWGSLGRATYWTTSDNVAHDMGTLAGDNNSGATAISANGQVIVGHSSNSGGDYRAFRWTQATGMQSVGQWLAGAGVSVPAGWKLLGATAVNQDGSVLVGDGTDASSNDVNWLARVGGYGSGLLTNIKAFNASLLESAGKSASAAAGVAGLALGGAHHRSLRDSGLVVTRDGACAWATADVARHNASDTTMNLVEAGACKDIGNTRIGLGVGQAWSNQGWDMGGSARFTGQYLIAEAASELGGGFELSLLGYYGRFATDLKRNYRNGAATDTSKATPDATSTAVRLRADWKDALSLASTRFSPYAAYTWTDTRLDSYTETGGGFPAHFAATTQRSQDLRLGLAAKTPVASNTDLRAAVEAAHRFDESLSGSSGQVLGLWSFSVPGQKTTQNWSRLLLDLDHRLGKGSLLNLSLTAATSGGDASWGASLGYRAAF